MMRKIKASVESIERICQVCDEHKGTVVMLLCNSQSDKRRVAEIFVPYIMTISKSGCACDMRELNLLLAYKEPVIVSFKNESVIYITTAEDRVPSVKACVTINLLEVMFEESNTKNNHTAVRGTGAYVSVSGEQPK